MIGDLRAWVVSLLLAATALGGCVNETDRDTTYFVFIEESSATQGLAVTTDELEGPLAPLRTGFDQASRTGSAEVHLNSEQWSAASDFFRSRLGEFDFPIRILIQGSAYELTLMA